MIKRPTHLRTLVRMCSVMALQHRHGRCGDVPRIQRRGRARKINVVWRTAYPARQSSWWPVWSVGRPCLAATSLMSGVSQTPLFYVRRTWSLAHAAILLLLFTKGLRETFHRKLKSNSRFKTSLYVCDISVRFYPILPFLGLLKIE